ncbi:MAG TPA: hypothetical protein VJZ77_22100 [Blastocatellia bacterium]|nr:hypothetical protein [Blastocatellia bacterium]
MVQTFPDFESVLSILVRLGFMLFPALPIILLLIMLRVAYLVPEVIRRFREWWFGVGAAWSGRPAETVMICFRFDDSNLAAMGSVRPGAPAKDVMRELAALVNALMPEAGLPIVVTCLTNVFGQRLADSLPLLDQLGDQRVVMVSYALLKRR